MKQNKMEFTNKIAVANDAFLLSEDRFLLPKNWIWTQIGVIAEIKGGKRLPKRHIYSDVPTKYPYIRVTDFENMTVNDNKIVYIQPETYKVIKSYTISKDDIYISIAGTIGKVGLIPYNLDGANLTENAAKIANLNFIDIKCLTYILNSSFCQEQIKRFTISSNQPKLALFRIQQMSVPLPPLPEQHRIVAKIEELFSQLDAGVEALKKVRAELKRYRQAVLKDAFEGKLTEEWRRKYPSLPSAMLRGNGSPAPLSKEDKKRFDDLPSLPEGWTWAKTTDVCSSVRDGTHATPKYVIDGIPLVTSKNLKNGTIDFMTTKNISRADYESIKIRSGVEVGDVIMAMIGTVGNPVVVKTERKFSIKNVALFKKDPLVMSSDFLKYWLDSPLFGKLLEAKYLKGTTQKFIPLENLRALPVPFCLLSEQQVIISEIERRFSVADEVEKTVGACLQQAQRLRQSILKRAFEGKLVPQDPNDEPASVLLERIKLSKKSKDSKKESRQGKTR